jgi:hydroxymethylbilane synthase
MQKLIRIGTRESQLAKWQAIQVQSLLADRGWPSELVFISSDGDTDLTTPLYEIGVQGIFTKTLDHALLSKVIDVAVHSLKDVPTQLCAGIRQAAVLPRGNPRDLLVYKQALPDLYKDEKGSSGRQPSFTVATSSIRRRAQWLNRYPHHRIENLRGNVNTRLAKLFENAWDGAIFAAAGLERIGVVLNKAVELDWMLPAPGQGAIVVVCRESDGECFQACQLFDDPHTAICTQIERDFLRALLGGCSTPIGALAEIEDGDVYFRGNLLSPNGQRKAEIEKILPLDRSAEIGKTAAMELLAEGAKEIIDSFTR